MLAEVLAISSFVERIDGQSMMTTAADLMTKDILTVRPEMPVGDVARLILERKVTSLPVIDDEGKLVGIVGEGDLIRCSKAKRGANRSWWLNLMTGCSETEADMESQSKRLVEDVMSRDVLLASENESLMDLIELLSRRQIKRLPIVRGGKLVGIVSRVDVLRYIAANRVLRPDVLQKAS